jgi:SAM-dependent MidA family methyltransferase
MKALPSDELRGVVLANELLDNLPFRLLVCDGVWREAWVTHRAGSFSEVLYPLNDEPAFVLPAKPIHGARIPWQQDAGQWVTDILSRLNGRLVVIDYAVPLTAELAQRPWRDWLRTYAGHEKGAHYLRNVGAQDITTDVCIDQIIATCGQPDSVRSQSQFLQLWGIDDLVEEGKRIWNEESARPGLRAMKMRSRISEAEALLDPTGVGGFTVMEWTKL